MKMPARTYSYKRRIIYIDGSIQKWLLIALVALEVLLIAGALWLLYKQLVSTIEVNLYRAHSVGKPDINSLLASALIGLGGLIGANLIVLWAVDRVWARHLSSILHPFTDMISKAEKLDFSADAVVDVPHKVVSLAQSWRTKERQRLLDLRAAIEELQAPDITPSHPEDGRTRSALEHILGLLPHP